MATEQTTSPRCEPCSLLRLLRKTTRTPSSCRPITLAHCHAPVPAAALVSSSSRVSPPAVSPSTDPVRPHRPAGSTHHDDANATQPTQHRPSLLAAPGRPRWSLPKCRKSTPIIYPTLASETHLPACDRPKLSSRHSSSIPRAQIVSQITTVKNCVRGTDAGRRWVWLRFTTAGIRKPLQLL